MSVERAEVSYVEAFKDVLLMAYGRLQRIVQPQYALPAVFVEISLCVEPFRQLESNIVVGLVGVQLQQSLLQSAYAAVYAHVVVVEDDEHVVRRGRHVVESLKGQSAAHGAVAYNSHHMSLAVAGLLCSQCHSQRGRNRVRGMSAHKTVVFAF